MVCFTYIIINTLYKSYNNKITPIIINLIIIIIIIIIIIHLILYYFQFNITVVQLNYLSGFFSFVSVSHVGLTCLMYFVICVIMLCSCRYGPFGSWLSTLINKK